jgi:TRAP-type mannitol/chloroaromatic compound transport system permease small subunit
MKTTLRFLNKIIDFSGYICIAALLLMILNVFIDVFVRYVVFGLLQYFHWIAALDWFNKHLSWLGGIGMQELEWHFFSLMFLMGLGYTLKENGHVRVDVLYDNFSRRKQAWINITGGLILALPFCALIVYYGSDFFYESFVIMDNKGDPGSLPRLWPGKLIIPVAFSFLILSIISVILSEWMVIKEEEHEQEQEAQKEEEKLKTVNDIKGDAT